MAPGYAAFMDASLPEFGERLPHVTYVTRPSAYALVLDPDQRLAVVLADLGPFLPGGGIDPGESAEDAVRRETREECARDVEPLRPLGAAIEYVGNEREGGFAKISSFYEARWSGLPSEAGDAEYECVWMTLEEAADRLVHGSHAWALQRLIASLDA